MKASQRGPNRAQVQRCHKPPVLSQPPLSGTLSAMRSVGRIDQSSHYANNICIMLNGSLNQIVSMQHPTEFARVTRHAAEAGGRFACQNVKLRKACQIGGEVVGQSISQSLREVAAEAFERQNRYRWQHFPALDRSAGRTSSKPVYAETGQQHRQ